MGFSEYLFLFFQNGMHCEGKSVHCSSCWLLNVLTVFVMSKNFRGNTQVFMASLIFLLASTSSRINLLINENEANLQIGFPFLYFCVTLGNLQETKTYFSPNP